MKRLLLFLALCAIIPSVKAQSLTTEFNYKITYKIKLAQVTDIVTAKEASVELQKLFDSDLQKFDASTHEITIKSVFVEADTVFASQISELGYTLQSFSKIIRIQGIEGAK